MKKTATKRSHRSEIHISVLDRSSLEKYCEVRPHIVVSVSDPGSIPVTIPDNDRRRAVLRLAFEDEGNSFSQPFGTGMAREILELVGKHRKRITAIVVGCEMGQSRSAGIAAGLSRLINGKDEYYFKHYSPNRHVYRTLIEAAGL